ncbi:MAG: metal-dependent hydrolase [Gemmatimonadaceae bacterium]
MLRRASHVLAGAAAGALVVTLRARHHDIPLSSAELVGGLIGGVFGGVLPDILDPTTDSNHRRLAHSFAAGGTLLVRQVWKLREACEFHANEAAQRARTSPSGSRIRASHEGDEMFWRFAAGAWTGLLSGYASHLVLDAATPRGLPLLGS